MSLDEAQKSSWKQIKTAITSTPVLRPFDFTLPCIIDTDSSQFAAGGVLLQPHKFIGKIRPDDKSLVKESTALFPVAYMSHKYTPTQQRYSAQERECLAIVLALLHWKVWVEGSSITVRTDHESLATLRTKSEVTTRIIRFLDLIEHFDPRIVYRKGITNVLPDYLSRPIVNAEALKESSFYCLPKINFTEQTYSTGISPSKFRQIGAETAIFAVNLDDLTWIDLQRIHESMHTDEELPEALLEYRPHFTLGDGDNNTLFLKDTDELSLRKVVHSDELLQEATDLHIRLGHITAGILISELQKQYWHPDLILIAQEAIRVCENCQLYAAPHIPDLNLQPIPPPQPLQRWGIDFTGPILHTIHLLNAIDYATGYGVSEICNNTTSATFIDFMKRLIDRFGPPHEIISDNGRAFTSEESKAFLQENNIKAKVTSPYHPRTNGRCEKFNGILKSIWVKELRNLPAQDIHISHRKSLQIYNTRPSSNGYSPHFLLYGVAARLSNPIHNASYTREQTEGEDNGAVLDLTRRRHEQIQIIRDAVQGSKAIRSTIRQLLAEDKAHTRVFAKGDWVLRQRQRRHKFEPFYDGPYQVISINDNNYELATPGGLRLKNKYNGERLFPSYTISSQPVKSLWYGSKSLLEEDRKRLRKMALADPLME